MSPWWRSFSHRRVHDPRVVRSVEEQHPIVLALYVLAAVVGFIFSSILK
jgi:hypothetical protein